MITLQVKADVVKSARIPVYVQRLDLNSARVFAFCLCRLQLAQEVL